MYRSRHLAPIAAAAMLAGCGQAGYPELARAKAFAVQVVSDEFAEGKAADPLPLTDEASRLPQPDPAARVAAARRYGPVESVRPATCALPVQDTTRYCDGALFVCRVEGIARAGAFSANIGVCHSDTSGWRVAALAIRFPP